MSQPSRRPPIAAIFAGLALVALWLGAIGWTAWSMEEEADSRTVSAEEFDRTISDLEVLADEVGVLRGQVSSLRAEIAVFEAQAPDDGAMEGAAEDADTAEGTDAEAVTPEAAADEADGGAAEDRSDESGGAEESDGTDGASNLAGAPQSSAPAEPTPAKARPVVTDGQDLWSCSDFSTWEQAQAVLEANQPSDPNRIDSNGDGIACERLWREAQDAAAPESESEAVATPTPEETKGVDATPSSSE